MVLSSVPCTLSQPEAHTRSEIAWRGLAIKDQDRTMQGKGNLTCIHKHELQEHTKPLHDLARPRPSICLVLQHLHSSLGRVNFTPGVHTQRRGTGHTVAGTSLLDYR